MTRFSTVAASQEKATSDPREIIQIFKPWFLEKYRQGKLPSDWITPGSLKSSQFDHLENHINLNAFAEKFVRLEDAKTGKPSYLVNFEDKWDLLEHLRSHKQFALRRQWRFAKMNLSWLVLDPSKKGNNAAQTLEGFLPTKSPDSAAEYLLPDHGGQRLVFQIHIYPFSSGLEESLNVFTVPGDWKETKDWAEELLKAEKQKALERGAIGAQTRLLTDLRAAQSRVLANPEKNPLSPKQQLESIHLFEKAGEDAALHSSAAAELFGEEEMQAFFSNQEELEQFRSDLEPIKELLEFKVHSPGGDVRLNAATLSDILGKLAEFQKQARRLDLNLANSSDKLQKAIDTLDSGQKRFSPEIETRLGLRSHLLKNASAATERERQWLEKFDHLLSQNSLEKEASLISSLTTLLQQRRASVEGKTLPAQVTANETKSKNWISRWFSKDKPKKEEKNSEPDPIPLKTPYMFLNLFKSEVMNSATPPLYLTDGNLEQRLAVARNLRTGRTFYLLNQHLDTPSIHHSIEQDNLREIRTFPLKPEKTAIEPLPSLLSDEARDQDLYLVKMMDPHQTQQIFRARKMEFASPWLEPLVPHAPLGRFIETTEEHETPDAAGKLAAQAKRLIQQKLAGQEYALSQKNEFVASLTDLHSRLDQSHEALDTAQALHSINRRELTGAENLLLTHLFSLKEGKNRITRAHKALSLAKETLEKEAAGNLSAASPILSHLEEAIAKAKESEDVADFYEKLLQEKIDSFRYQMRPAPTLLDLLPPGMNDLK